MANAAMTNDDVIQHEGLRTLLDGLNQLSEQESIEFTKKIQEIEQLADEHTLPIEATWKDWQPSEKLVSTEATLNVIRSEVDDNNDTLVVVHHSELGSIGLWLPEGEWNVASGHQLSIGKTRVKLAPPTPELQEKHSLRGLVAVEDTSMLLFSAPKDDFIVETDN